MRPHVEIVHEDDYVRHVAELPHGDGIAHERRLSVDEEDGSASLRVDFAGAWSRGPGIHHANAEYFVLDGVMIYDGVRYGTGAYLRAPKGVPVAGLQFTEGTRILHYRQYGGAAFDPVVSAAAARWEGASGDVVVRDSAAMPWDPVGTDGPAPGLFIKYLYIDPVTGFYTRLVHARGGWSDDRVEHHPCFEEGYTVQGRCEYNFGTLDPGTYFFRPARVKHSHFTSLAGGTTWLLRSDGPMQNWYTDNVWIRWGGEALNYGPDGGTLRWSVSSADLADPDLRRAERDPGVTQQIDAMRREQGLSPDPLLARRAESDLSVRAIARAVDPAAAVGGAGLRDAPIPAFDWGADPRSLEHSDERAGDSRHDWGAAHLWRPGMPIPGPIVSTLPVRSRSRGRWDGMSM